MTLCVGKATKDLVILLSDSRIFDPSDRARRSVTTGSLKTVFLSRSAAVAFSGDPHLPGMAVAEFRKLHGHEAPYKATIDFFANASRETANEYILAFCGPKTIVRIEAGNADARKNAWIGDHVAFAKFQSALQPNRFDRNWRATTFGPDLADPNFVADQIARFQEVVESPDVASTGDFFTIAIGDQRGFRYCLMATLYFDQQASPLLGPGGSAILRSTGENRVYRHQVWTPKDPAHSAAVFTFPEAQLAFAFYSKSYNFANTVELLKYTSRADLTNQLNNIIGIEFDFVDAWHA